MSLLIIIYSKFAFTGLKTIVSALLRACRMLLEVILLTLFCLMVFAMFGLQVYNGVLRQKCVKEVTGYTTSLSQSFDEYYAEWIRNQGKYFFNTFDTINTYYPMPLLSSPYSKSDAALYPFYVLSVRPSVHDAPDGIVLVTETCQSISRLYFSMG